MQFLRPWLRPAGLVSPPPGGSNRPGKVGPGSFLSSGDCRPAYTPR